MNDEKRLQRRRRLMDNKAYQTMQGLSRYMDRYYLDALIGVIPGWGDAIALICVVPFVYFSSRVIKSIPLTLAVINNALRDILLGMIPFFVGDIIDIFHRANIQNMQNYPTTAHSSDDMGTHQFRQLPIFIGSIHLLTCQYLTELINCAAFIPKVGTFNSQAGNTLFPTWE